MHLELFLELKKSLAFYLEKVQEYDKNNGFNQYKISVLLEHRAKIDRLFHNIDPNVKADIQVEAICVSNMYFVDVDKPDRPGNLCPSRFFGGEYLSQFLWQIPDKVNTAFQQNPSMILPNLEVICYVQLVQLQMIFNIFSYFDNELTNSVLKFLHKSLIELIESNLSQYDKVGLKKRFEELKINSFNQTQTQKSKSERNKQKLTLNDVCRDDCFEFIINKLTVNNYISDDHKIKKSGAKKTLIQILKLCAQRNYYKKRKITNDDYVNIVYHSFGLAVGIDTVKQAMPKDLKKEVTNDFPECPE